MERIRKKPIQIYRYIQMFSKNSHAYRAYAHTVRVKDLPFHLYHLYVYVFGQWTVMDSSFLKSLTGTARTCGTRDKFRNFTVHYCPLSKKRNTEGKAPPQHRDDLVISTKNELTERSSLLACYRRDARTVPSEFFVQNVM